MHLGLNPWQCNRKLLLLLVLVSLTGCFVLPAVLHRLEFIAQQLFFTWRGPITPPPQITLVSLNQQAAENLGQSRQVFSRTHHAQLINDLTNAQAALVVFDVAFKSARSEEEDLRLQTAIAAANRVVLFDYLKRFQVDNPQSESSADVEEFIPPLKRFADVARGSGHFVLPKTQASVAFFYPVLEVQGQPRLSQPLVAYSLFAPQLWRQYLDKVKQAGAPMAHGEYDWVAIKDFSAPQKSAFAKLCQDASCQTLWRCFNSPEGVLINFYGPPGHLPQWPIDQVLAMSAQEKSRYFAGKIVYVGLIENQQTEQQDAYRTVFTKANGLDLSGVEISANVLGNLLQGNFLIPLSYWQQVFVLILLYTTLVVGVQTLSAKVFWWVGGVALALYVLSAYWLFLAHNLIIPVAAPLIVAALFLGLDISMRLRANKARYQNLLTDLSNYMPEQAAKALSQQISNFAEHNKVVSGVCLMTDIQGYTRLAEELPPAQLHELMNSYYAELIAEVKASGGIVGNIVGDALLALWLDNHVSLDACLRASRTACAIQQRLAQHPHLQQLPTSCAVHGGEFSLGHLGASGHFEFSPVGDMVNTVSRMEPFNRQLGTRILVSQTIASVMSAAPMNHASGEFALRDLGPFSLRNKKETVRFYHLYQPGVNPAQNTLESAFAHALKLYLQSPLDALEFFQALVAQFPQDGPSQYYLRQCKQLLNSAAQ